MSNSTNETSGGSYQEDFAPSQMGSVIEHIVDMVTSAKAVPMTSTVLVNRTEILDLLASARQALPEDVAAADNIIAEADTVLLRAREEAETALADAIERAQDLEAQAEADASNTRETAEEEATRIVEEARAEADRTREESRSRSEQMLREAHARAEQMISQERVIAEANARAGEMLEKAESDCVRLAQDADEYCDSRLSELEGILTQVIRQTRSGRAKLAQRAGFEPHIES